MIKKEITFIYGDSVEKSTADVIADEAVKQGYKVKFSMNRFEKCEIGVYCSHQNFPSNSKFSVVILHDILQGYEDWPDMWYRENWQKYDVGCLIGKQFEDNWNQCSQYYYARPRKGVFVAGWPKSDRFAKIDQDSIRKEWNEKYGLDPDKKTILYAPAWENDDKEDDFVKAMQKLDVNILIKQHKFNANNYSHQQFELIERSVAEMYEKHKDIPGVYILPRETNIFYAICMSDILVTEESSTMSEAVMMGKPAVSVYDWLIPDTTPSRYPSQTYDFAVKTKIAELPGTVQTILDNYDEYTGAAEKYSSENFKVDGHSAERIVNIIDHYVSGAKLETKPLTPKADVPVSPEKKKHLKVMDVKWWLYYGPIKHSRLLMKMYDSYEKHKANKQNN